MIKDTYVYATKTNLSLIIGDFFIEKAGKSRAKIIKVLISEKSHKRALAKILSKWYSFIRKIINYQNNKKRGE